MGSYLGPMIHFTPGWKVSFVPMRADQLLCNDEGKPLVLQKHVDEGLDMSWPLALPAMADGVATQIVQDLAIHQPNKRAKGDSPVLAHRRHCPRLPSSVSAA